MALGRQRPCPYCTIQESLSTGTAATMSILQDSGKSRHWKVLALGRQRPCPYCTIQESVGTGTAATMSILHDHLRVRKRCACGSPTRCQTNNDRLGFVLCEFMLRKVNGSRSKLTWEVLTGDETWIYRYNPETKMQSTVWLFLDESPLHKLKR